MTIKQMWKYLIFQTRGYKIINVVMVLGVFSETSAVYINSFFYAKMVDSLIKKNYEKGIYLSLIMVIAVLILHIVERGCKQIFEHYIRPCRDETKERTVNKAFSMDYEEFEKKETLLALRRVRAGESGNAEIDEFLREIYEFFLECVKVLFAIAFLVILFMKINIKKENMVETIIYTIVLFVLFIGILWINFKLSIKSGEKMVSMNKKSIVLNSVAEYLNNLICSVSNAKDIRLLRIQDYLMKKSQVVCKSGIDYRNHNIYMGKSLALCSVAIHVLTGYIYIYTALLAIEGRISVGDVLMYAGAIITMAMSMQEVLNKYKHISYTNEYLSIYEEFIEKIDKHGEGEGIIAPKNRKTYKISFSKVYFKYPGTNNYILKDVSIDFINGEKVALVGMNGAGKTTLIKLLLRLYEPTEGEIKLNGVNIKNYNYEEYLKMFSVVFQDFKLFDFPLDENIASGCKIDYKKLMRVISQVGLKNRIANMPQKEHSILYNENGKGVMLSGGEAQKIAIARALYKDAPIIILDEPTAALDPVAEADVYENFASLIGEKTAIYISHRMSSCKFCDRIIVIDEGSVVEEGGHDKLMQANGIYARLYIAQATYYN